MREDDRDERNAVDEDGVIDLGAASEVTEGIPSHLTVEAFMSRPPFGELSVD